MPLATGARLGPYEITGLLGAGGMGEVYKARDERLGRTVAIKVSAAAFSERFEREARSVAALNHPNICQLYDVGPNYLVMEFVDGRPASPVDSARKLIDLAVQMADGLAAAHSAGLVHRDLKPDNILVGPDGRVKILDFGLAKAWSPSAAEGPTRTSLTDPGTTLGTVAYMSPEQARGEPNLGPQSDQFSLGLVLYEMAAGRRAFRRDSSAETMAAIIRDEPEPLPGSVPAPLRWVIERLLSKDPADRYDSSRDLYRELRQIRDRLSQTTAAQPATAAPSRARVRFFRSAALAAAGLAAGAALAVLLIPHRAGTGPDLSKYRFTPITTDPVTERAPAWSPDGKTIAYLASLNGVLQVMTRVVGAAESAQLTHLRHSVQGRPFWSPDGSTIYFVARAGGESGDRSLWSVNATGGTPEEVIEDVDSAAIHPDGRTFAFARNGKLWIGEDRRSGHGSAREFGKPPFEGAGVVDGFSPDGSRLAVSKGGVPWLLTFPSGEARRFAIVANGTSWMPDSRRLVVVSLPGPNMTLSMLDTATGTARVIYLSAYSLLTPAVSPDGHRIAFMGGDVSWELAEIQVPSGRVRTMPSAGGVSWWPAWAPSGTHYAFIADRSAQPSVRDMNADGGLAFSRILAAMPETGISLNSLRWAPDGNRFSFTIERAAGPVLMIGNASGSTPQPVDEGATASEQGIWSPDGVWIAYQRRVGTDEQLVKARAGSRGQPEILKSWSRGSPNGADRTPMAWSPDGRWILAARAQPGIFLVSSDGATERLLFPRRTRTLAFAHDGRSVINLEQNTSGEGAPWRLWSIDVATGAERLLANVPLPPTAGTAAGFSLHPDGTRFLTSIANWPFDIWMFEGFDQ
jgi:Tol biopolymer transport system component/predicted Ser/Thr protein kinase